MITHWSLAPSAPAADAWGPFPVFRGLRTIPIRIRGAISPHAPENGFAETLRVAGVAELGGLVAEFSFRSRGLRALGGTRPREGRVTLIPVGAQYLATGVGARVRGQAGCVFGIQLGPGAPESAREEIIVPRIEHGVIRFEATVSVLASINVTCARGTAAPGRDATCDVGGEIRFVRGVGARVLSLRGAGSTSAARRPSASVDVPLLSAGQVIHFTPQPLGSGGDPARVTRVRILYDGAPLD